MGGRAGDDFSITPAVAAPDVAAVADLFRAYAASLAVDLAYQGFSDELAGLPGAYAPPDGALLLARRGNGVPAGCVAMRPLPGEAPGICEMKRLYVAPEGRGAGLGRALVAAVLEAARRAGYREVRLDALPGMDAALALYRAAGFRPTAPYYPTPVEGTAFLARPIAP